MYKRGERILKFTEHELNQMIDEQRNFFFSGQTKDVEFRKTQLKSLKGTIKKYEKEILLALKKDLGKSEFEAYSNEVGIVLDSIGYMIKNIDEWVKPEQIKTPIHFQPAKSFVVREPYGVTLIIGPFNYPFQLIMEPLLGAVVGGNTAIVKPSEAAENTTKIIKKIIEETFDPSFVRVVEGEKEEVNLLIHAPFDYIFFTGSVSVGKIVMRAASERLTPITLELGGKSPVIVDQTANLNVAAKRIVWGKFSNNGQTCVAPDYLLVHETVYEQFVQQIKGTIRNFYGDNPQNSEDYGRVINTKHVERLYELLKLEREYITYGGTVDVEDRYIEPTILENITWENPIMEDEIFGPILPIMKYTSLHKIIHEIRQKPKPLAAYLFSENEKAMDFFLNELSFGGGCINDTLVHVGNTHLPFGGVGPSGINHYHGKASFENFTHPKSIMKRSTKMNNNILYPPYKGKTKLVRMILK